MNNKKVVNDFVKHVQNPAERPIGVAGYDKVLKAMDEDLKIAKD